MEKAETVEVYPSGWKQIFELLEPDSSLRTPIANFGVKFRLTHELTSSAFAGDSTSSDAYYVMLKASLLYSAIEAWELVAGKGTLAVSSSDLAGELRSNPMWTGLRRKLQDSLTSKKLLAKLDEFSSGQSDDLLPVIGAIRHGFFHPALTASNSSMSNTQLRKTVMRVLENVRDSLDANFKKYVDELAHWNELCRLYEEGEAGDEETHGEAELLSVIAGHTRTSLQQRFNVELTDRRWAILIGEVMDEDEFSHDETTLEVASDIESYEADVDLIMGPGAWPWSKLT